MIPTTIPFTLEPIRIVAISERTAGVNQAVDPSITPSTAPAISPTIGLFIASHLLTLFRESADYFNAGARKYNSSFTAK
jgi:hypothetical protein